MKKYIKNFWILLSVYILSAIFVIIQLKKLTALTLLIILVVQILLSSIISYNIFRKKVYEYESIFKISIVNSMLLFIYTMFQNIIIHNKDNIANIMSNSSNLQSSHVKVAIGSPITTAITTMIICFVIHIFILNNLKHKAKK